MSITRYPEPDSFALILSLFFWRVNLKGSKTGESTQNSFSDHSEGLFCTPLPLYTGDSTPCWLRPLWTRTCHVVVAVSGSQTRVPEIDFINSLQVTQAFLWGDSVPTPWHRYSGRAQTKAHHPEPADGGLRINCSSRRRCHILFSLSNFPGAWTLHSFA